MVTDYPIDRDILVPVFGIESSGLGESEREYLTDLRAYYDGEDV